MKITINWDTKTIESIDQETQLMQGNEQADLLTIAVHPIPTEISIFALSFKRADNRVIGELMPDDYKTFEDKKEYYYDLSSKSGVLEVDGGLQISVWSIIKNVEVIDPNTNPPTVKEFIIKKCVGNVISKVSKTQVVEPIYVTDREGNVINIIDAFEKYALAFNNMQTNIDIRIDSKLDKDVYEREIAAIHRIIDNEGTGIIQRLNGIDQALTHVATKSALDDTNRKFNKYVELAPENAKAYIEQNSNKIVIKNDYEQELIVDDNGVRLHALNTSNDIDSNSIDEAELYYNDKAELIQKKKMADGTTIESPVVIATEMANEINPVKQKANANEGNIKTIKSYFENGKAKSLNHTLSVLSKVFDGSTNITISKSDIVDAIGLASYNLNQSGLMSATDKHNLDTLITYFNSNNDDFVNRLEEVLAIFDKYPKGSNLVDLLKSKANADEVYKKVDVYNKNEADTKYVQKSPTNSQYIISQLNGKLVIRNDYEQEFIVDNSGVKLHAQNTRNNPDSTDIKDASLFFDDGAKLKLHKVRFDGEVYDHNVLDEDDLDFIQDTIDWKIEENLKNTVKNSVAGSKNKIQHTKQSIWIYNNDGDDEVSEGIIVNDNYITIYSTNAYETDTGEEIETSLDILNGKIYLTKYIKTDTGEPQKVSGKLVSSAEVLQRNPYGATVYVEQDYNKIKIINDSTMGFQVDEQNVKMFNNSDNGMNSEVYFDRDNLFKIKKTYENGVVRNDKILDTSDYEVIMDKLSQRNMSLRTYTGNTLMHQVHPLAYRKGLLNKLGGKSSVYKTIDLTSLNWNFNGVYYIATLNDVFGSADLTPDFITSKGYIPRSNNTHYSNLNNYISVSDNKEIYITSDTAPSGTLTYKSTELQISYPQTIKSVSKNLVDNVINNFTPSFFIDRDIFLPSGTYTISIDLINGTGAKQFAVTFDGNVDYNAYSVDTQYCVINVSNSGIHNLKIYLNASSSQARLMINKGDTPLPYEPYREITQSLENVVSYVAEKLVSDYGWTNEMANKWLGYAINDNARNLLHNVNGKALVPIVPIDLGTINYEYVGALANDGIFPFSLNNRKINTNVANVLCANYSAYISTNWDLDDKKIVVINGQDNLRIRDTSCHTIEQLKAKLSGVYLLYELATPIEIPLTNLQESDEINLIGGGSIIVLNQDNKPFESMLSYDYIVKVVDDNE